MEKIVLVTTGATVTFKQLIVLSMSKLVLDKLVELKFSKIVVQFGYSSEDMFISILKELGCPSETQQLEGKTTITSKYRGMEIEGINFDKDLSKNYTQNATLVISHGGSGSILDALRLHKKLIVLNNDELSEGHQLDIINEFLVKGHLIYCDDNFLDTKLSQCIDEAKSTDLQPINQSNGHIIQDIILQCLI